MIPMKTVRRRWHVVLGKSGWVSLYCFGRWGYFRSGEVLQSMEVRIDVIVV
jgi:hypothetical protein